MLTNKVQKLHTPQKFYENKIKNKIFRLFFSHIGNEQSALMS